MGRGTVCAAPSYSGAGAEREWGVLSSGLAAVVLLVTAATVARLGWKVFSWVWS
jgi:hypothetical protein